MTDIRSDLGEIDLPPRFDEIVGNIVQSNIKMMKRTDTGAKRAQHPKGHGLVEGTVTIDTGARPDLAVGIFSETEPMSAQIRFSNGAKSDDSQEDAHGMAIKLTRKDGSIADLILLDSETFFLGDLEEYDAFNDLLAEIVNARRNGEDKIAALLNGLYLKFIRRHTKGDLLGPALEISSQQPVSPLRANYFSAVPYLLGDRAVKYMARPVPAPTDQELTGGVEGQDGLGDALMSGLMAGPAAFDLFVDVQSTPEDHPVEDPTVNWSEEGAERFRIGRIDIPQVDETGVARARQMVDDISFNPWNAPEENRPMGIINRIRQRVYKELSAARA